MGCLVLSSSTVLTLREVFQMYRSSLASIPHAPWDFLAHCRAGTPPPGCSQRSCSPCYGLMQMEKIWVIFLIQDNFKLQGFFFFNNLSLCFIFSNEVLVRGYHIIIEANKRMSVKKLKKGMKNI